MIEYGCWTSLKYGYASILLNLKTSDKSEDKNLPNAEILFLDANKKIARQANSALGFSIFFKNM